MPVSIPYTFTPETEADANEVNSNFQAIAAKLNGGIVDGDISGAAGIDGNKLSQASGKQIPTGALATNAVSDRVLASDTGSPGSDAARAVSGAHVKAWTAADFQRIVPALAILAGQVKFVTYTNAAGVVVGAGSAVSHNTAISTTGNIPIMVYFTTTTMAASPTRLHAIAGTFQIYLINESGGSLTYNAGEIKFVYLAVA